MRNRRVRNLVEQMEKENLDALFLQGSDNVKYVTDGQVNFSYYLYTRFATLLTRDGDYTYFCPSGEVETTKLYCPWIKSIQKLPMYFREQVPYIIQAIKEKRLHKGRIGLDFPVYQIYKSLEKELPKAELIDSTDMLDRARAIKSGEELKAIKESVAIAEIGMNAALESVREGRWEYQIALSAEKAVRDQGAEYFPSYVASGENSGRNIESNLHKRVRNGDLVTIDTGCTFCGYIAEFTRTTIAGTPSEEQKSIYQSVFKAEHEMMKMMKPGIKTTDADKVARSVIKNAGFERWTSDHISGHGIGVGYHEQPIIGEVVGAGKKAELAAGMVCCIEPAVYHPRVGGVRLEDILAIKENETEVLTRTGYCDDLLEGFTR